MAEFVRAANASEVPPGTGRLVNLKGKEIALFNVEGTFFALDNACPHEEGPLAEGDIEDMKSPAPGTARGSTPAPGRCCAHQPLRMSSVTTCA
jgi:hypothetical protein